MWFRDEFLNYWWNNKKIYVTSHALDELDEENEIMDTVCEVLDKGEHKVESKREGKHIANLKIGKTIFEVVYAISNSTCVIIHFGSKRL